MTLREQQEDLERKLAEVSHQIQNCNHEYGEAKYDPKKVRVPYGYRMSSQGSDIYCEPAGYREETSDRWSQTCRKCGHVRYTTNVQPVVTSYKPVF